MKIAVVGKRKDTKMEKKTVLMVIKPKVSVSGDRIKRSRSDVVAVKSNFKLSMRHKQRKIMSP